MKEAVVRMSVKTLVVTYALLLSLVIILAVPVSLLVWVVCLVLSEIVKVGQLVYYCLCALGALVAKQMLNGKLPQSANATRRKHNVRQG